MDTNELSRTTCNRDSELVTYLYNEASEVERRSFEQHLEACSTCRGELKAFQSVRTRLGAWNPGLGFAAPRIEISIKRNSIESLRELLGLFSMWPVWLRFAGATATAALALLFVFSLTGTRVNLREGTIAFGWKQVREIGPTTRAVVGDNGQDAIQLTRSEIETMISERVSAARAEDRRQEDELHARIASLSVQLANAGRAQDRLAVSLATLRSEQRALAAKGQSTLGEWLFAANGTREPWGGDNEKDN